MPQAHHRLSCPLPTGERATLFCNIKKWVRGFRYISVAGNPLTRTLSPNGGREHTEFAARSCTTCAAVRFCDFARGTELATGLIGLTLVLGTGSAGAQAPSWLDPGLLPAAKAEGSLIVYSSTNEQEGLPLFKLFTEASGIAVEYVGASDAVLMSRMGMEFRAGVRYYDMVNEAAMHKIGSQYLLM